MSDDAQQPEEEVVYVPESNLRWLSDSYYQTQKFRIQVGNQLSAVARLADRGPAPSAILSLFTHLQDAEEALAKDMGAGINGHPAMRWLGEVRGIGPILAGKLLGLIDDIGKFATASKLRRFAGYAVIDGKRERPTKGEKLHYNTRLKSLCWLIVSSMLRSGGSPYRVVYDTQKARYEEIHPDWTKGHRHLAAMRKVSSLFLSHLWETWRMAEGLPVRPPYAEEYLHHTAITNPWDFVGKAKQKAS